MLRFREESGQSMVEFALVLPIFLMIIFALIDFSWIGYQCVCFDYSYREASWELSVNDEQIDRVKDITGRDAVKLIIDNVKNSALGIITDNLSVSKDAKIHLWSKIRTDNFPAAYGGYEVKENYWRYMELTAKLNYKIYPITPMGKLMFPNAITFTKNVDKTRMLRMQNK